MPPPETTMTFTTGQAVPWRHAPGGIAQIEDLLRRRVRLFYRCKNGRIRRPLVRASELKDELLFRLHNPFDRGVMPRSKTYRMK